MFLLITEGILVKNILRRSFHFTSVGLDGKWVTKSGFVFEINAGYGFLLFNANKTDHNIVNKIGLYVGYRF